MILYIVKIRCSKYCVTFSKLQKITGRICSLIHCIVRFDLIDLILDKPDEQTDRRLAKHVVGALI